jgi:hypothetical protein
MRSRSSLRSMPPSLRLSFNVFSFDDIQREVVFCFGRFRNQSFASERFRNQSKACGRGTRYRMAITLGTRVGIVVHCGLWLIGRTTKFTRRARVTLISQPTLPPARVQRLVIRLLQFSHAEHLRRFSSRGRQCS